MRTAGSPTGLRAEHTLVPLARPDPHCPFDNLTTDSDLTAAPPTIEFARLSRATLAHAIVDITRVGAHSMRRGRFVGLFHGGAQRAAVSEARRHSDPRSLAPYELVTARNAALALTMCDAAPAVSPACVAAGTGPYRSERALDPLHGPAPPAPRLAGHPLHAPQLPGLVGLHDAPQHCLLFSLLTAAYPLFSIHAEI